MGTCVVHRLVAWHVVGCVYVCGVNGRVQLAVRLEVVAPTLVLAQALGKALVVSRFRVRPIPV